MNHKELIELYFEDKLNTEQKLVFDDLLSTDDSFRAQYEFEAQVKKAVISTKKDSLRNYLQQLEYGSTKNISFRYYKIAISVVLIISLSIVGISQLNRPVSNDRIFAEYFKPYENAILPNSRGNEVESLKAIAFRNYDAKNYKLASDQFSGLYKITSISYYLFYQAMCEMKLGKIDKSINLLNSHKKYSDNLSQHRNWYLALAYLKANRTNESIKILQQIVSNRTYKHKDAEIILKKLN